MIYCFINTKQTIRIGGGFTHIGGGGVTVNSWINVQTTRR